MYSSNTYAAIGQQLTAPENGWNRFDDTDSNIQYEGTGWFKSTNGTFYNGSEILTNSKEDKAIKVNFVGTKIRLITTVSVWKTQTYTLTLDGVEYPYTQYNTQSKFQAVSFEKMNLAAGEHSLIIKTNGAIGMDAIDVDGNLKVYNPNINDVPKEEPTPDSPTTPAIPEPTPDPAPTPTPTPESPTAPDTVVKQNRAILVITMDTGLEKEFDLSMQEINDFIAWYEAKQSGTGKAAYAINKHDNNKGPFTSRKDYVIFNKILTFEVSEYSNN